MGNRKKYTYINDNFEVKGKKVLKGKGGIYCYTPFQGLDSHGKTLFKVGLTKNFNYRAEQGYTSFPLGVFWIAFLTDLKIRGSSSLRTRGDIKNTYTLNSVEDYIFSNLLLAGAKRIHSDTRINRQNEEGKGASEWFYTDIETIHKVFNEATKTKKYAGSSFYPDYKTAEMNRFYNKVLDDKIKNKKDSETIFEGKIIYFV